MALHLVRNGSKYDLIHVFGNVTVTSVAISYAKITGKPLVVELVNLVDDPSQYEPRLLSWLFGEGFPSKTLLICLSEHLKTACLNYGYREDQIWCRANPIDEERFNCIRNAGKRPVELAEYSPSDILILHLAKFIPRKKQLFMVEVMPHLPENFKLILAGPIVDSGPLAERDREYFEAIQKAIRSYHLEHRVRVIPRFIEAPDAFMKAVDVFVLPSVGEAFGTPFLEAIACGVPAVVNRIPGVFDHWIRPGVNGYLCEFDPQEWADNVQAACRIPDTVRRQASEDVLQVASTGAIDREYYRRLTTLATG